MTTVSVRDDIEDVVSEGAETPGTPPSIRRHRVDPRLRPSALVAMGCATGLTVVVTAYRCVDVLSGAAVQVLLFTGLLVQFLPAVGVMIGRSARRGERAAAGVMAGIALYASEWLSHPLVLGRFDEMLHTASLRTLINERSFFQPNTVLPISPYYPGLETVTAGVHWTTGLPVLASEVVVVTASRIVLLLGLFLVAERLTGSSRAAGTATALYLANPQFYLFDSQFAYETLALALAVTAVLCVLRVCDARRPRGHLVAAVAVLALLATTHHVTSWCLLVVLLTAAVWLRVIGNRRAARVFGLVTLLDLTLVGLWTLVVGSRITGYLGPVVAQAGDSLGAIVVGRSGSQTLFASNAGGSTPLLEQLAVIGAVLVWSVLLVVATLARSSRQMLRARPALWLLVVGSAGYLVVMAAHVSASAAQFGTRASALVFFPVAVWIAAWWSSAAGRAPRGRFATGVAIAVVGGLAVGGVLFGAGPAYERVPGPYLVSADQRSMDGDTIAAATWARRHVPAGTRVAADRDNSVALAALGGLAPVTQVSGAVNVGPLYFADAIGPAQVATVRDAGIRLLVVDTRLATGLPRVGVYFEPGETFDPAVRADVPRRLTPAELAKFASWSDAEPVYANAAITIYDTSAALGEPPVTLSARPVIDPATTWSIPLGVMCLLVAAFVGSTVARRRPTVGPGDPVERTLAVLVATMLGMATVAVVVVLTPAAPWTVAVAALAALTGAVVAVGRGRVVRRLRVGHWATTTVATTAALVGLVVVAGTVWSAW